VSVYLFANNASTTVSSGGTDAPASGTAEAWRVASSALFPEASSTGAPPTVFAVQDPAAPTEVILVTEVAATSLTSALVSGTAYTSLAVGALPQAMVSGDTLVVGVGATTQNVVLSAAAAAGATSLTITSVTPTADFAVGSPVADVTTPGANVGGTTWGVTRGAEGTVPVAHIAGFTVQNVATAGGMGDATSLQGVPLAATPPAAGQVPVYSGSLWVPTTPATVDTTDTPIADTQAGAPGTNAAASSANHSHPLSKLYNAMHFGFPRSYNNVDFTFDATDTLPGTNLNYGFYGYNDYNFASLSGSVYTLNVCPFFGRNIVVDSGITVQALPSAQPGCIVLVASESIVIEGSLLSAGLAASGAAGGGGSPGGSGYPAWCGLSGATGVAAAAAGASATGVILMAGGQGGNGGASGSNGGGSGSNQLGGGGVFGVGDGLVWLWGNQHAIFPPDVGTTLNFAVIGGGGGAGAGDGTYAGGGGGGGGSWIMLLAPSVTIGSTAVLDVSGGAGAAGTGGNAGGGGGGGSGLISIHTLDLTIESGAVLTNGPGAGGAGSGTGSSGQAGSAAGFTDPPVADGGFGYGQGFLICEWQ